VKRLSFELDDESHVEFFRTLVKVKDGERYVVGRPDTRTFVELPEVGAQAITLLQKGLSVREVQEELKNRFEKEFDVKSFIHELLSSGFVKSIEGHAVTGVPVEGQIVEVKGERKRLLKIRAEHVKWLFSRPFLGGFFAPVITAGIIIMLLNPSYWPKPEDLLFHESLTLVLLGVYGISFILLFLHEIAHLFAAIPLGVQGNIKLSNRLFYIVLETNLTNLWMVPRKKRYPAYLAGLIIDITVISTFTILMWLSDIKVLGGSGGIFYGLAKAAIFLELLRVAWQFMFFMKTDIYHLFADYFKCKNLYGDTMNYITNKLMKLFGKSDRQRDMSFIPENEMRVIRKYAIFFLAGTGISLFLYVFLIIPLMAIILISTAQHLLSGYVGNEAAFIDSIVIISLIALNFTLLGYSLWKKSRLVFRRKTAKSLREPTLKE